MSGTLSWPVHSLEHHDGILGTLRRGVVVKVDDSGVQQLLDVQGLASDQPQGVWHLFPHGFSSNSPTGADGILKALGGRSDRLIFIGGEHNKYRQKNLPSGNAVLYDDKGNVVWMQSGQGIAVTAAAGNIVVTTQKGTVSIDASGQIVYLGGNPSKGGAFAAVLTEAGPSPFVMARIG